MRRKTCLAALVALCSSPALLAACTSEDGLADADAGPSDDAGGPRDAHADADPGDDGGLRDADAPDGGPETVRALMMSVFANGPSGTALSRNEYDIFPTDGNRGPASVHWFSYWMKLPSDYVERATSVRQDWRMLWEMKLPGNDKWRCHVHLYMDDDAPYWVFKGLVEPEHSPTGEGYDEYRVNNRDVPVLLGEWFRIWIGMRFSGDRDDGYFKLYVGERAETMIFDRAHRIGHPTLSTAAGNTIDFIAPLKNYTGWAMDGVDSTTYYTGFTIYDAMPVELGGSGEPIFGPTYFEPDTGLDPDVEGTGHVLVGTDLASGDDWGLLRDDGFRYSRSWFQYVSGRDEATWSEHVRTAIVEVAAPGGSSR